MTIESILTAQKITKIEAIIKALAETVSTFDCSKEAHGLLSGLAGQLLFLYKAHQYNSDWVNETRFEEKLEQLQDALGEQSFEMSNGLAGQTWLLEYLNQANEEDYDVELLADIDQLFADALSVSPWPGEIEYVLGMAGYAPYAARRAKFSDQTVLYRTILDAFKSTMVELNDGHITWSQPSNSVYRLNKDDLISAEYNLGLAHGVPAVIAAILPALSIPSLKDEVTTLLLGSCDWLIAQASSNKEDESWFGSCVGKGHRSRLGWCYGDLTIALTLARVGLALDRPSYVEFAQKMALNSASRDAKSGNIIDAGICHGYVGLVTIYQLLNHFMPHPQFVAAVEYWLDHALAQYDEKGVESLHAFYGMDSSYKADYGLLMGFAGVGVGLISVLTNDVDWADCLLMA